MNNASRPVHHYLVCGELKDRGGWCKNTIPCSRHTHSRYYHPHGTVAQRAFADKYADDLRVKDKLRKLARAFLDRARTTVDLITPIPADTDYRDRTTIEQTRSARINLLTSTWYEIRAFENLPYIQSARDLKELEAQSTQLAYETVATYGDVVIDNYASVASATTGVPGTTKSDTPQRRTVGKTKFAKDPPTSLADTLAELDKQRLLLIKAEISLDDQKVRLVKIQADNYTTKSADDAKIARLSNKLSNMEKEATRREKDFTLLQKWHAKELQKKQAIQDEFRSDFADTNSRHRNMVARFQSELDAQRRVLATKDGGLVIVDDTPDNTDELNRLRARVSELEVQLDDLELTHVSSDSD